MLQSVKAMRGSKQKKVVAVEGLRARKRRQTRERISNAAMTLFLERGFDATTVDDIAAAADVSKRGFFDYFPTKEDVVAAWQDEFGDALAAAVAARPEKENPVKVIEEALTASIIAAVNPQSLAINRLVHDTPALRARNQMKYAKLEQSLAEALTRRAKGKSDPLRIRLLAMVAIGAMRVAGEVWEAEDLSKRPAARVKKLADMLWSELREVGVAASRDKTR
jgi:AcrR family transcriptional regulator